MRRADGPSMHTDDRTRQRCYSPGFCTLGEEVEELRVALREAINWSYGDGPTPEERGRLEALLSENGRWPNA